MRLILDKQWNELYIHSLVPEYKIYIRHHSHTNEETVMYAHI